MPVVGPQNGGKTVDNQGANVVNLMYYIGVSVILAEQHRCGSTGKKLGSDMLLTFML
jgi:hypothetical protein